MRSISSRSLILCLLFFLAAMNGFSQKKQAAFILTLSFTPDQTAAPQSIDLDALTQVPDSFLSLIKVVDGKKHLIAAQIGKKGRASSCSMTAKNAEQAENAWQQYADRKASVITISK